MAGIKLSDGEHKRRIMDCLRDQPMTVESLAKRLLCAPDMVRKRLRELQEETRTVRVVGWDMKSGKLVRVWGIGAKRRRAPVVPPPSKAKRKAMRQGEPVCTDAGEPKEEGNEGGSPVSFRLEALDKWLFDIRRAS